MTKTKFLFAAAFLISGVAHAQSAEYGEASTTIKLEDVRDDRNKVTGNIDEEITNARLRAESGSKSKWSLSGTTQYTGGSAQNAFGSERPLLVAEPGKQDSTSLDFGLNGRYRWTKNYSLTLGTNFGVNTPFQGNQTPGHSQLNVYDPELSINRVGKVGVLQTNGRFGISLGTSTQSQAVDKAATYTLEYAALRSFDNGLTAGVMVAGMYNQFGSKAGGNAANRAALAKTYGDAGNYYGGDSRSEYNLALFPFAEYAFNDQFQLRTVFGYFNYRHLLGDDKSGRWLRQSAYQSVGLGMAISRNVYLYPNLQFVPDDIRIERTNVAFAATLNMF